MASIDAKDIGDATRALIVTNGMVSDHCADLIADIQSQIDIEVDVLILRGESSKVMDQVSLIIDACIDREMSRKDVLIAVGGGVIGDTVGFAASIYLRGIPFIQVPTSLLAQVDAAIGGKTGVNHSRVKNLIGSFYQPIKTIIDQCVVNVVGG